MPEIEKETFSLHPQTFTESSRETSLQPGAGRAKSAQRLRYEAEIGVLKRKLGDLESIRRQLGLSQRKICQLLLVDPSAWTRWVRPNESAPPHIYRSLQWYLALQEKYPALDVNFWLSTAPRAQAPLANDTAWETTIGELQALRSKVESLQEKCDALALTSLAQPRPSPNPRFSFILGFLLAIGIASLIGAVLL